jgi:hypothetical protein
MTRAPAQNRVLPTGQIVSVPARGSWMGNRGQLHRGSGTRQVARASHSRAWLICTLEYKSRVLPQWQSGHNTQLFFHDEAVALAAGHRPCAECRRPRFTQFRHLAGTALGSEVNAPELDRVLHGQRQPGSHIDPDLYWSAPWGLLPTGAFVIGDDGAPELVLQNHLVTFDAATYAYGTARPRPRNGPATVLTPPLTVQVMVLGYQPHISAQAAFAALNQDSPAPGAATTPQTALSETHRSNHPQKP